MTDYFRGSRPEALSTCGPFGREGTGLQRRLLSRTGASPPPPPRIPLPRNRTPPRRGQRAARQTRRQSALWRRRAFRQRSSSERQPRSRGLEGDRRLIQRRTRAARGIGMDPARASSPRGKRGKMGTAARGKDKRRERPAPPAPGPSSPHPPEGPGSPPDGPRRRAICFRKAVRGRNRAERTGPRLSPPLGQNRPRAEGDGPAPPRGLRAHCRRPG